MNSNALIGSFAKSAKSTSQSSAYAITLLHHHLTSVLILRTIRQQCWAVGKFHLRRRDLGLQYQHLLARPSCSSARKREPPSLRYAFAAPAKWIRRKTVRRKTFDIERDHQPPKRADRVADAFLREKWNDQVSKTKQRSWQRAKERDETIKVNDFRVWSVVWLMIFFGKNEFFAFGWDRLDFTVSNQDDFYMFRVNDTQWYEI